MSPPPPTPTLVSRKPATLARIKGTQKSDVTNGTDFPNGATERRSTIKKRSLCSVYCNKENKKNQTTAIKSRNCLDVVRKTNLAVEVGNTVHPKSDSTKAEKNGYHRRDVAFIRQLLVLNKKQELLLNIKLAELLRDDPEISHKERKLINLNPEERYSSSTLSISDPDFEKPQFVLNSNNFSKKGVGVKPRSRVEYDLNGRRVYQEKDEDDNDSVSADTADDGQQDQIEMISRNAQTWFNTTTLIQAKSDMSCNQNNVGSVSAQRKSLTVVNQQSMCKLKPRERCLSLCSDRGGYNQRSCYTRGYEPTGKETVFCKRTVHGDGVQNVIAHCCEVDLNKSGSKKRIHRVWNYHDIPKIPSDGSASDGGKTMDSHGGTGAKSTRCNTPKMLKTTIPPVRNNRLPHTQDH